VGIDWIVGDSSLQCRFDLICSTRIGWKLHTQCANSECATVGKKVFLGPLQRSRAEADELSEGFLGTGILQGWKEWGAHASLGYPLSVSYRVVLVPGTCWVKKKIHRECHRLCKYQELYHRWWLGYGVAAISRLLQITGLFCKRALYKRRYSAEETYDLKEPTNRRHLI